MSQDVSSSSPRPGSLPTRSFQPLERPCRHLREPYYILSPIQQTEGGRFAVSARPIKRLASAEEAELQQYEELESVDLDFRGCCPWLSCLGCTRRARNPGLRIHSTGALWSGLLACPWLWVGMCFGCVPLSRMATIVVRVTLRGHTCWVL
jgi:hypothetical protein